MKRNGILGCAALTTVFALISAIVFLVPTEKTEAFWISYSFTAAIFLLQIPTWKSSLRRGPTAESRFFGLPTVQITTTCLVTQVVTLAVFTALPGVPTWVAIVANTIIVGVSATCFVGAEAARGEIERVDERARKKVFYIREIQTQVEALEDRETDNKVREELSRLAEQIRFSDPMSCDELGGIEKSIRAKFSELGQASDPDEKLALIKETSLLIKERNRKCKLSK